MQTIYTSVIIFVVLVIRFLEYFLFKQSIAVTGSSGFLGHALVAELSRRIFWFTR